MYIKDYLSRFRKVDQPLHSVASGISTISGVLKFKKREYMCVIALV